MKFLRFLIYCIVLITAILLPASAASTDGWTNQTINNNFIVLLPSGWSNFPISSYAGPATGVMDNQETGNVIAIQISTNTNCSVDNQENLKVNLENFNAKAGIANLTPQEYGTDNVTEFGKYNDGKYTNVFLRLYEGNVITVFGTYQTEKDAKDKAEQFERIAGSVFALNPVVNDMCVNVTTTPTPVPTYKPRVVPTVKNTVTPTIAPTPKQQ
jgi:hypothetical protein